MDIRVINAEGWEKTYQVEKTIVRIGSGTGCDVLLNDPSVAQIHLQLTSSATALTKCNLRCFSSGVHIYRGDQLLECAVHSPYDLMNHDELRLSNYRIFVDMEGDSIYRRSSKHMEAALEVAENTLTPQTPVSGVLTMKNTGTEHPCQFSMKISGLPDECLQNGPMPFLFPDSSGSVGFVISHRGVLPAPGIHNLTLMLYAPKDYFGEMVVFKFPINAAAEFNNNFVLSDDTDQLSEERRAESKIRKARESESALEQGPVETTQLDGLRAENDQLKQSVEELKSRHGQWVIDNGELKDENTRVLKENDRLSGINSQLTDTNLQLSESKKQLETQNSEMLGELAHLRDSNIELTREVEQLSAKFGQLKNEFDQVAEENQQLKVETQQVKNVSTQHGYSVQTEALIEDEPLSIADAKPEAGMTEAQAAMKPVAVQAPEIKPIEITVKRHVPSKPSIPVFGRETRRYFDEEPASTTDNGGGRV